MRQLTRILAAAAVAAAVTAVPTTRAEILIYNLSFNTTGPSVNYSFLVGGFLVVDENAGSVSSVVVLNDPDTFRPYYAAGLLTAAYTELLAEGSGREYALIYSTGSASVGADNVAMQLLGRTSEREKVGGGNHLSIARKLSGYLFASAAESSTTDEDGNLAFAYGFAGTSKVTAKLEGDLTNEANDNRLDAATTLSALTTLLERRGINPEASPTPSPTPTP